MGHEMIADNSRSLLQHHLVGGQSQMTEAQISDPDEQLFVKLVLLLSQQPLRWCHASSCSHHTQMNQLIHTLHKPTTSHTANHSSIVWKQSSWLFSWSGFCTGKSLTCILSCCRWCFLTSKAETNGGCPEASHIVRNILQIVTRSWYDHEQSCYPSCIMLVRHDLLLVQPDVI